MLFSKDNLKYYKLYNSFDALKLAVDMQIIEAQTGTVLNNVQMVKVMQLPCQSYDNDSLKSRFLFFLTIIVDIIYILTVLVTIRNMINEKETKMRVNVVFIFEVLEKFRNFVSND
jgi:hypothetical protein